MTLRKVIFITCIAVLSVLFIEGIYALSIINSRIRPKGDIAYPNTLQQKAPARINEEIPAPDPELESEKNYEWKFGTYDYNPVNILILGLDEYEERSDVIIVANFNPNDGRLNLLSIARDTRIVTGGKYVKINALVGMGGEELAVRKIEELLNITIPYYATLNFEGFKKLIDIVDGVEMDIPFNMNYDDPEQGLHIHLKKGKQILNGEKAVKFVRYRKGNRPGTGYTNGDLDRIKAQQDLLKALVEQKLKFKYLSKIDDVFIILKKYMKTNIELPDINYYLTGLTNMRYEKVKTFTLPGESVYLHRVWYYICDREKTRKLIEENFIK